MYITITSDYTFQVVGEFSIDSVKHLFPPSLGWQGDSQLNGIKPSTGLHFKLDPTFTLKVQWSLLVPLYQLIFNNNLHKRLQLTFLQSIPVYLHTLKILWWRLLLKQSGPRRCYWQPADSHHCLGLNLAQGMWKSCQWLGIRQCMVMIWHKIAFEAEWSKVLLLTACRLSLLPWLKSGSRGAKKLPVTWH